MARGGGAGEQHRRPQRLWQVGAIVFVCTAPAAGLAIYSLLIYRLRRSVINATAWICMQKLKCYSSPGGGCPAPLQTLQLQPLTGASRGTASPPHAPALQNVLDHH